MNDIKSNVLISVIIPVYKVEKYIERCARSLFGQTMIEGVEFIFVDDCTPDNSIELLKKILEEYPQRKSQVRIIHHEKNLGSAAARKSGLSEAKGEYIVWCDSDDWMEKNAFQILSEKVLSESLDMVIYNNYYVDKSNQIKSNQDINIEDSTSKDTLAIFFAHKIKYPLWAKMARRILYENRNFIYPTSSFAEDFAYSLQLCYLSKSTGYVLTPLYYYVYNPMSQVNMLSESQCLRRCHDFKDNLNLTLQFLKDQNIYEKYKNSLPNIMLECRAFIIPYIDKNYVLWKSIYPELDTWECIQMLSLRNKIKYLIIRLHLYKLYLFLQNVYKILCK